MTKASLPEPIRIGVSGCLLGEKVRFDGGHKRDGFLVDILRSSVEWVSVCPEVEIGLGVPRPTMRLVADGGRSRLVTVDGGVDHTDSMRRWARRRVASLADADLSGYVLKKDSPTCGMERVRVYGANGRPQRNGRGLFAEMLIETFPHLPVEEEGRLNDPRLRESFIERAFAYRRLRSLFAGRWTLGHLVAFHTAHKLQLLSHSPKRYESLGRMVARGKRMVRDELHRCYEAEFMQALAILAPARRHVNVLHHIVGYFKKQLEPDLRREVLELIEDYRKGLVPRIVPITLIRHHVRRLHLTYLEGQTYLEPHPGELMLRNHV